MADEQVGTVSVRAIPDTKGFRAKLKAFLDRLERELDLDIEVGLQINRRDLLRARREIKALERGATIKVKVELDKSGIAAEVNRIISQANRDADNNPIQPKVKPAPWDLKEFTNSLRTSIDEAISKIDAEVPVELQDSDLRAQLQKLIADAENMGKVEIEAELEDSDFRAQYQALRSEINDVTAKIKLDADTKAAAAQLEGFLQQMRDKKIELPIELDGATEAALQAEELARSRQLDIYAVLHAARAAAQIAVLTHSRTLDVRAHVRGSALGQIAGLIAGLAGLRAVFDVSSGLTSFLGQIDRAVPRIAAMTVGVAGLSAAVLAAGGGLAQFAVGVGQSLRGLILLPAIIAGVATSFFVLRRAFQDAGQYIGDLGPQYQALGRQMSAGYWSVAEGSVRRFTASFIPLASVWLPRVAEQLGWMTNAISAAFTDFGGMAVMETFFSNLTRGLDIAGDGVGWLTQGILDLVGAGSKQFPRMATQFNHWMESFSQWSDRVTSDGSFERWVDQAAAATKDLGSILSSTTRVFLAVADAAKAAGSPGLSQMAAGMRDVADAAESTRGMEFMTTMFAGANQGVKNLLPGLRELGNSFVDLGPVMGRIMEISGTIFSELAYGLSDILDNPRFQSGIVDMFESFENAARNLQPVFQTAGTDIGMLAETVGMVAEAMSQVLGVAAEELGTVFQNLLSAVQDIIPPLRDGFIWALELIGPAASLAAEGVAAFVDAFPGLSAALLIAGVALGIFIQVIGLVARPLVAAASGFVALKAALPGLASALSGALGSFSGITGIIGRLAPLALRLAGWVGLAAGAFALMYQNSEPLRDSLSNLWDSIRNLGEELADTLGPSLERISNESLPGLIDAFGELLGVLGPVFGFLGDQAARTIESLATVIEGLTPAIVTLIDGIVNTFTAGLEFLSSLIGTWADVFQGDWEGAWQGLQDTARAAFDVLGTIAETGIRTMMDAMTGMLDAAAPGWREEWNRIGVDGINALAEALGMSTPELVDAVTNLGNLVTTTLENTLNGESGGLQSIGIKIVTELAMGIETAKGVLATAITTLAAEIVTQFTTLQTSLSTVFTVIREQMILAIADLVSGVVEGFLQLGPQVITALEGLPVQLVALVASWFMAMVAGAAQGQVLLMQEFYLLPQRIRDTLITGGATIIAAVTSWFTGMQTETETGMVAMETQVATLPQRLQAILAIGGQLLQQEVFNWFMNMQTAVLTGIASIVSQFATMPSRIQQALSGILSQLVSTTISWFTGMVAQVVSGVTRISVQFATLPGRIMAAIAGILAMLVSTAVSWFTGMLSAIVSGISQVVAQFQALGPQIMSALAGVVSQMVSVGVDMMTGLISGIVSMAANVASAAAGVAKGAYEAAKAALEINSPSRLFIALGEGTGEGMVKGIEHSESSVLKAMTRMVQPPKAVDPTFGRGALAMAASGQEINVMVQSRDGEDPTRVGRRAGEAIAFELGRHQ